MTTPAGIEPVLALVELSCKHRYSRTDRVPEVGEMGICTECGVVEITDVIQALPLDPKMGWAVKRDDRDSVFRYGEGVRNPWHPSQGPQG